MKAPSNAVKSDNAQKAAPENDKAPSYEAGSNAEPASQTNAASASQPEQLPSNLIRMMKDTTLNDTSMPSSNVDILGRRDNSDTKSIASRTTLTLDEKESLMPDDSASMQGARDEEIVSPAEPAHTEFPVHDPDEARAFRDQLYEIDRHGGKSVQLAQRPIAPTIANPQQDAGIVFTSSGASAQPPEVTLARDPPGGPPPGLILPPDDKLLEALNSPKDRLFVLKIEQDFIDFIKNSKEVELQLPSTNTFYRLLSHKLAEYYFLGHVYEESLKAVRIRKLPYTRLAPPLIGSEPKSEGPTPPPTASMKIMRRGQNGLTPPTLASRPQSSSGYDAMGEAIDDDQDPQKRLRDKSALTREEREKQYQEARARIFQGFDENQPESAEGSGNQSKEMSRSSSNSGAKKAKRGKRPKDDSFEARSSYTSVDGQAFVNNSYIQPQASAAFFNNTSLFPQYPGMPAQFQSPPQNFHVPHQDLGNPQPWPAYQQYSQPYPMQPSMAGYSQFSSQQFDQSIGFYGSPQMPSQSTPKAQAPNLAGYFPTPQPQGDASGWAQPGFQAPYGQQNVFSPDGNQQAYMVPYGYDPSTQQPMHGFNAFSGQQFNPQSQSFIPNAPMTPMQGWPQQPQTPTNFPSPHFQQVSPSRNGPNSNNRGKGGSKHGQGQQNGSIAKWANSSSLPAKPPPTTSALSFQMPRHMEQGQPLPNKPFGANGRA